ncbi:MAG: hypothetical protein IJC61_05585, partial [Oscillospiraceae bacterium]|nr:hypothetical protein [Oscillospiraceae bacterium]
MQAQCISKQSIEQFLMWLRQQGAAARQLSACRRAAQLLYEWLPQDDKSLSPQLLAKWKQSLGEQGYSDATVAHYIKAINRYFDYAGLSELKLKRGKQLDLTGRRFGELTAIKAMGSNDRREKLWL